MGSSFTYGLIAVVLALLAVVIFGMYYRVAVLSDPFLLGVGMTMFFVFGIFLRVRRKRLHSRAFEGELRIREALPPD